MNKLLVFTAALFQISCSAPNYGIYPVIVENRCETFFLNELNIARLSYDNKIAFIHQSKVSDMLTFGKYTYRSNLYIVNIDGTNLKLIKELSINDPLNPRRNLFWSGDSKQIYVQEFDEKISYRGFSLDGNEITLSSDSLEAKFLNPEYKFEIVEEKNNSNKIKLFYSNRERDTGSKDITIDLSFLDLDNYSNLKIEILENKKVYITKMPEFSSSKKDPFLFYAIGDLNFSSGEITNVDVFRKSYLESPFYLSVIRFINNKLYYIFDRKIFEYDLTTKNEIELGGENNLNQIKEKYNLNKKYIAINAQYTTDKYLLRPIIKKLDIPKSKEYQNCDYK